MRDGVKGCLVARTHQQIEEGRQLLWCETLSIGVGGHQLGDQIVARMLLAVVGQLGDEPVELGTRRLQGQAEAFAGLVGDIFRVGASEETVGRLEGVVVTDVR